MNESSEWLVSGGRTKHAMHRHGERLVEAKGGTVSTHPTGTLKGIPVKLVNTQRFTCPECNAVFDYEWPA